MSPRGARPGDWNTQPMPERHAQLAYQRSFSAAEMAKLREGFTPADNEDKWFVVFSDEALWFHRSWTGSCIYRVRFEERLERHLVSEVLVNRDPAQYRNADDAADVRTLDALLDSLLR
jgi:hypothetical protein